MERSDSKDKVIPRASYQLINQQASSSSSNTNLQSSIPQIPSNPQLPSNPQYSNIQNASQNFASYTQNVSQPAGNVLSTQRLPVFQSQHTPDQIVKIEDEEGNSQKIIRTSIILSDPQNLFSQRQRIQQSQGNQIYSCNICTCRLQQLQAQQFQQGIQPLNTNMNMYNPQHQQTLYQQFYQQNLINEGQIKQEDQEFRQQVKEEINIIRGQLVKVEEDEPCYEMDQDVSEQENEAELSRTYFAYSRSFFQDVDLLQENEQEVVLQARISLHTLGNNNPNMIRELLSTFGKYVSDTILDQELVALRNNELNVKELPSKIRKEISIHLQKKKENRGDLLFLLLNKRFGRIFFQFLRYAVPQFQSAPENTKYSKVYVLANFLVQFQTTKHLLFWVLQPGYKKKFMNLSLEPELLQTMEQYKEQA